MTLMLHEVQSLICRLADKSEDFKGMKNPSRDGSGVGSLGVNLLSMVLSMGKRDGGTSIRVEEMEKGRGRRKKSRGQGGE